MTLESVPGSLLVDFKFCLPSLALVGIFACSPMCWRVGHGVNLQCKRMNLSEVSHTAILTLVYRVVESEKVNPVFNDPKVGICHTE
jgi:hypothetical protein